ncbi:MAG: LicD family protein [Anaerocolumna sp.]
MERLNEYQYDQYLTITKYEQLNKHEFKGKRIIISGSISMSLTQNIVGSILAFNDKFHLGIKVYFVYSPEVDFRKFDCFFEDEVLTCVSINDLAIIIDADYFIYTGSCNKKITDNTINKQKKEISTILQQVNILKIKKVLLVSDYRAYDVAVSNVIVSELEYVSKSSTLIRELEHHWNQLVKEQGVDSVILRMAIAIGAYCEFDSHPLHQLFEHIVNGKNNMVGLADNKFSFVSIHDMLTSIVYVLQEPKGSGTFNVVADNGTVDLFEICSVVYNAVKETKNLEVKIQENAAMEPVALDDSKLRLLKYQPTVSFRDALEIHLKSLILDEESFLFNDTYHGKLEAIHDLMLVVLNEVDKICKENNIKYFLGGGTLLGAIRHKGFIPWDDDADIMMLRGEYEKFIKVAETELPEFLVLQTAENDPSNHFLSKIRVKNTICSTKFTKELTELEQGFFVDIFPHDYTANSHVGQKIHCAVTVLGRSLVFNKWGKTYVQGNGEHKLFRFIATIIKTITPMFILEWFQFYVIRFFEHKKNNQYLYDGMGQNLNKGAFPTEWLHDVVFTEFEGYHFPIPREYDKYLKFLYGDYMRLIPVSERKNSHNIYMLDMGTFIE